MDKVFSIILLTGIMFSCAACAQVRKVNDTPVKTLDFNRYLGTWYEIARFDHRFEKGIEFTQAVYSLKPDGTVRVENSGIKDTKFKRSIGKAFRPDAEKEPARMRVSFFGPFYSDYRVLMIDPDYKYALVSSKGPNYLWILSRELTLPPAVKQSIIYEAQSRGFDTSRLKWVLQQRESLFIEQ